VTSATAASPPARCGSSELLEALTRIARLEREVASFRAVLAPRARPLDRWDEALLPVLRESSGGRAFTCAAIWEARRRDDGLRAALQAAVLDSPRKLGKLLRRLGGRDVAGLTVERVAQTRTGISWRIVRME
jgi:hypothetical protein